MSSPELSLQLGRATAGLPSLGSSKRFQRDASAAKLDKQAAIHRQIEQRRDEALRPVRGIDITEVKACIGYRPMRATEVIQKLQKLNPNLRFPHHPFLDCFQVCRGEKYICRFGDALLPMLDIKKWHWEEHVKGQGKDARLEQVKVIDEVLERGWTDLLRSLIRKRLISQPAAEREFDYVLGDIDVE